MPITDHDYTHSDREFTELVGFLRATYALTRQPANWLFGRLEDWRYGGNAQRALSDPTFFARNTHLWREGEKLVGFCVAEYGDGISLQVHPEYRHVEHDMLCWATEVWGQGHETVEVTAWAGDAFRAALLAGFGFEDQGPAGNLREYDVTQERAPVPLEPGYRLTSLAENDDHDSHIAAVSSAFGRASLNREWFENKLCAPSYALAWDLAVVSPVGQHVAFCTAWLDRANAMAEIDPVGTHADFRQRGFAKAVVTECFRRLAAEGIRTAYIGSAPEPNVSNRLYEALRPAGRWEEHCWVRKMGSGVTGQA